MSTGRQIDAICIAAVAVILVLTIVLMACAPGLAKADRTLGYENRLFNTDRVHTIDIVMNDWDSFLENCENEEYAACTVLIDGEKFGNVAIRAKGNTSLSSVSAMGSQRYSLKLEFDHYQNGKSYYGLDKLCLNNLIQDNTMMKDYLAYQLMASFGVETPLCSYVYITVNGEDWGLFLAVEGVEDSFLERNYGRSSDDLYKPDSLSFGGGRGNGRDFDINDFDFSGDSESADTSTAAAQGGQFPSMGGGQFPDMSSGQFPDMGSGQFPNMSGGQFPQMGGSGDTADGETSQDMPSFAGMAMSFGGFGMGSSDVKLQYIDDDPDSYSNIFNNAKTTVTEADQARLIASLKKLSENTDLEEVVNTDEVLRYFVVHNFLVNSDSYTGMMIHNYYLHESDGQLSMIPWDYNLGYGTFQGGNASSSVNADIDAPVTGGMDDRPMIAWIFANEEYTEQYHALFSEFLSEWLSSGKLTQMIGDTADMLRSYVQKDPTKFCTEEEFETGVAALTQFVDLRTEAITRQLNGDKTAVDTGDLNLSDMGSMGQTGGFGGRTGTDSASGADAGGMPGNFPSSFSGSMPDVPQGSPQGGMPDASQGGGNMPTGADFSGSSGGSFGGSSGASASAPSESGDNADAQAEQPDTGSTVPSEAASGSRPQPPAGTDAAASGSRQGSSALWLGISAAVMVLGLLIAWKKKY